MKMGILVGYFVGAAWAASSTHSPIDLHASPSLEKIGQFPAVPMVFPVSDTVAPDALAVTGELAAFAASPAATVPAVSVTISLPV